MKMLVFMCILLTNILPASLVNIPSLSYNSEVCDPRTNMLGAKQRHQNESQTEITQVDVKSVNSALDSLNSTYLWQKSWPNKTLGSVSAVAFDLEGNVVVFHRGDRTWNQSTFNVSNYYTGNKTAISIPTLVAVNRNTGSVAYETGVGLFFMPHGLTIDKQGMFYVTDVALHQVFMFRRDGSLLHKEWEMGDRFVPKKFCKPTSVAVLDNGDFFVADGYCHSKIIKYSKDRAEILRWGENSFQGHSYPVAPQNFFAVPHSLTIADDLNLLCVADRENGRVQCFNCSNGTFHSQFHSPVIGDRLFSVAYLPKDGGQLLVVNGPILQAPQSNEVVGFVVSMKSGCILSKISPKSLRDPHNFENPHDIIVSRDGKEVYIANLAPNLVYKMVNTDIEAYNTSFSSQVTQINYIISNNASSGPQPQPSFSTVFLFVMLPLGIVMAIALLLFMISKRRRLGCCNVKALSNRRHQYAWEFPRTVSTKRFKRPKKPKHGFDPVNQDASDEELVPMATILIKK